MCFALHRELEYSNGYWLCILGIAAVTYTVYALMKKAKFIN